MAFGQVQPNAEKTSSFVIRFWHEWSAAGHRWRGDIRHLESGRHLAFQDVECMVAFIQSLGIMLPNDATQEDS